MTGLWLTSILLITPATATLASVRALTIEGNSVEGTWRGLDAAGAILIELTGKTAAVPIARLMTLKWHDVGPAGAPSTRPATVHLLDGSRLYAGIVGGDGKHLELETGPAARLMVDLNRLAAIRFSNRDHAAARETFDQALAERHRSQDVLIVLRDDRVTALRGVTESLGPKGGSFNWRGRSVPIDPQTAYGLILAAGVDSPPAPPAVCELRDGSAWGGRIAGGSADEIELELAGGRTITLPIAQLSQIRFQNDHVVFLDELEPVAYEFEPFATTRWPYRLNRSAANRPMRIGDQTFERGIGMHSKAALTYELADRFTHLAAVIGIDEAVGDLGNVVFLVIADDKEVFNSGPVTGRDPPRHILVPIKGARQVKLVVDFGEQLDIGDQADWAAARFIK